MIEHQLASLHTAPAGRANLREGGFGIRDIRYFLRLAKDLQAARSWSRSRTSASSLSLAIAVMEQTLGLESASFSEAVEELARRTLDAQRRSNARSVRRERADADASSNAMRTTATLRIGLADGIARSAVDRLRMQSLEEDPDTHLSSYELPLPQQIRGLHHGLLDVGFSLTPVSDGTVHSLALWRGRMVATVPACHMLASEESLPLAVIARHPLVLCQQDEVPMGAGMLEQTMRSISLRLDIRERVASHRLMRTLVAAGYGLGVSTDIHLHDPDGPNVVIRPVIGWPSDPTTYLLHCPGRSNAWTHRYIDRALRSSGAQRETS